MLSGRCRKVKLEGMICIDPAGLGLEGKDEKRFPEGWVFQFRFQHKIGNCQSQSRKLTMPTMTMLQSKIRLCSSTQH